jgi:tetratricopeptide (TPR) repeat protein
MKLRSLILLLCASSLVGCFGSAPSKRQGDKNRVTLGDLIPIHVSATSDVTEVNTESLIQTYRDLLAETDDEDVKAHVSARIASLELVLQDQKAAQSEEEGDGTYLPDYTEAIASYQAALAQYPDRVTNDQLYYQLAKSYDLSGDSANALATLTTLVEKYPQSEYVIEAQFRRGDYLFSLGQFKPSQDAYQVVINDGEDTPFYENAVYMHGWTLFKRNFYEPSAHSFVKVLDRTMPEDGRVEGVDPNQKALVDDSLRVLGMIFSYLDGADTIAGLFEDVGPRSYEALLYERLGELYISQQRYRDAIKVFEAYIAFNPYNPDAPQLQNRIVNTMLQAKFYKEAFKAKQDFITHYAVDGEYYSQADEETQQYLQSYLYVYIDEVARFYHARAQGEKKALARYKEAPPTRKRKMLEDYKTAIEYYDFFVVSFPNDVHAVEKTYMMAEAYAELNDWNNAVKYYERVAYDYGINNFSEDAAYASILGYKKLVAEKREAEQKDIEVKRKLAAQVAFAQTYAFSKYGRPVMLDSIDMMFKQKDYQRAAEQAERFLALQPPPSDKEMLPILLVLSHSKYETEQYADAEKAYYQALEYMPKNDKRRPQLMDRIAASVYKQGEALAKDGKQLEAVDQFLRVGVISPNSKYRKTAEYDAATYLVQAEEWDKALELLQNYRKRYDPKRDDLEITAKMILVYEGQGQLDKAADELQYVVKNAKDPEKKRQALFLSAEYYERSGDNQRALNMYRSYANQYPEPFDLAMETRYKLSNMYLKLNDDYRRRFWLEKIIVSDAKAGDKRTDRSRYLAAYSRNIFAKDYLRDYQKIKLTSPLKKSLGKKKKAMETALAKYQQIIDYNVQEFATQSTYYIGTIYSQLSKDLMDSERPKGFSELELEQYSLLLEEQAYPFEESAIEIHETNVQNSWNGNYDKWVGKSIEALSVLLPGQYNKKETVAEFSDVIF